MSSQLPCSIVDKITATLFYSKQDHSYLKLYKMVYFTSVLLIKINDGLFWILSSMPTVWRNLYEKIEIGRLTHWPTIYVCLMKYFKASGSTMHGERWNNKTFHYNLNLYNNNAWNSGLKKYLCTSLLIHKFSLKKKITLFNK